MASKSSQDRTTIARIAASARWGNSSPELDVKQRDLAAERLAEYVRKVVDAAPPLTPEQRDRIAALLRPSVGASA
ncbi:hypothetical protein E3O51_05595 [Cryobacterium sp. MDB2-10]|nr:hypothetical protein E3O51_05595 [Cryobacterium sp. MDB2-10]